MLDRAGDAASDVEFGGDHLAGLADLPVVRGIARIDGGAAGADGGAELVGDRDDDLLEILLGADAAAARDDDAGGGELRPVALGKGFADEGGEGRIGRGGDGLDRAGRAGAGGGERGGADGRDLLCVLRLDRLDGVAGVDRPLEGVGRDDLGDLGDLHHVEQGGDARQHVLGRRGRRGDDRVVAAGERDEECGERLGKAVAEARIVGEQHLGDAVEPGGFVGDGGAAAAGNEGVDVTAEGDGGGQGLGGLAGKGGVVVFDEEKGGHLCSLLFRARRLRL